MISKETMDSCKEVLATYCRTKKYCVNCVTHETHTQCEVVQGTLKIGPLEVLMSVLDGVLHDTSTTRFRLSEAAKYLESEGYIEIKNVTQFGATIFWATPKLIEEDKHKQMIMTDTRLV